MASLLKRAWSTLSEPRFVSGLAITVYLICLFLGMELLHQPRPLPLMQLVPGLLLTIGSIAAIPCAWIGKYWGKSFEKTALVSVAFGLIAGALVEIDSPLNNTLMVHYVLALLLICFLFAIARWIQLSVEIRRDEREATKAVRAKFLDHA